MPPSSWFCKECDSPVVLDQEDSTILMRCKCSGLSDNGFNLPFALDSIRKPIERTLFGKTEKKTRPLSQVEVGLLLAVGFLLSSYFAYELLRSFLHKLFFFL
ncbi:hypothetical protein L596_009268 [Steinernema carpocapsae]|uniref:Uncharacterized protein n=1 Tax=Steinernema carpocapsae TaxID=34508 RepID=A0A4U5PF15_STECR|nr:hypothetical protein L596_009268 [Steinernema carpocapsae]